MSRRAYSEAFIILQQPIWAALSSFDLHSRAAGKIPHLAIVEPFGISTAAASLSNIVTEFQGLFQEFRTQMTGPRP
jgi:hypothetical protein